MLTENKEDGFLIDLDLIIRISDNHASGARSKTRIKIFIITGALLNKPHSFIHDLESFFWLLFWIYIYYEGRNKKGKSKRRIVPKYEKWNYVNTEELAKMKLGQISKRRFDNVDKNSTEYCKPLIPCIRGLHWVIWFSTSRTKIAIA